MGKSCIGGLISGVSRAICAGITVFGGSREGRTNEVLFAAMEKAIY